MKGGATTAWPCATLGIYDMSADEYGFTIHVDGTWDELNELWKEAIEARREADDDNSAAWVR